MKTKVLNHKGYTGTIDFSLKDNILFGKIIGIDDLVSYEAENLSQLKKSFKEAVEDYLDNCKEIGKNPDKTFSGTFNVRTSNQLHKKLSFLASSRNMKLNEVVNVACDFLVKNEDKILADWPWNLGAGLQCMPSIW